MKYIGNLTPQIHNIDGHTIYGFHSDATPIVRILLSFDAGHFYQHRILTADAANQLFSEGTTAHTAQQLSEFEDFRGIIIEKDKQFYTADVSVYMLRKYADEFLPLLHEMLTQPLFDSRDFEIYKTKKRHTIQNLELKASAVARKLYDVAIYGADHPRSQFATPDDVDRLDLDEIKQFFDQHYRLDQAHIVIAGNYDLPLLHICAELFGGTAYAAPDQLDRCHIQQQPPQKITHTLGRSDQSSVRIGYQLPIAWSHPDYTPLMVLNTLLGGYFGSRLMSNIREDKGYTYGINSFTTATRDGILFTIASEIATESVTDAISEIHFEMERLRQEEVPNGELAMVCRYMEGDFLRSIDGVFERSERCSQMYSNGITDHFTQQYLNTIQHITPQQIQQIAQKYLLCDKMNEVIVS